MSPVPAVEVCVRRTRRVTLGSVSEPGDETKPPLRLTKDVREALLRVNEGFTDRTHYSDNNFTETRHYKIADGQLRVNSSSNTSWADSRRADDFVADEAATHRFLRQRLWRLDTDGVAEEAAAIKAARKAADTATNAGKRMPTPDLSKASPVSHEYPYVPDDDEDDVSWSGLGARLGVLAAITALAWVAPRAEEAWRTTAKPKLKEWRARRAARTTSQDAEATPMEPPGDSPPIDASADDLD